MSNGQAARVSGWSKKNIQTSGRRQRWAPSTTTGLAEAGSGATERQKRRVLWLSGTGRLMPGGRLVGWRSGWALKAAWWETKTLCGCAKITLTKTSRPGLPHLSVLHGNTRKAAKGWFTKVKVPGSHFI